MKYNQFLKQLKMIDYITALKKISY